MEFDNQVVGFIVLIGNEIVAIFLQPEHHGKKIGKLMMDKAQEQHGDLEVEVFEKNSIGRKFYSQIDCKTKRSNGRQLLRKERLI